MLISKLENGNFIDRIQHKVCPHHSLLRESSRLSRWILIGQYNFIIFSWLANMIEFLSSDWSIGQILSSDWLIFSGSCSKDRREQMQLLCESAWPQSVSWSWSLWIPRQYWGSGQWDWVWSWWLWTEGCGSCASDKFQTPLVDVWIRGNEAPEHVDMFSKNTIPKRSSLVDDDDDVEDDDAPELYIGIHKKQLYIQESIMMHRGTDDAIRDLTEVGLRCPCPGCSSGSHTWCRQAGLRTMTNHEASGDKVIILSSDWSIVVTLSLSSDWSTYIY